MRRALATDLGADCMPGGRRRSSTSSRTPSSTAAASASSTRQIDLPIGMATDQRHPQPAQALEAQHGARAHHMTGPRTSRSAARAPHSRGRRQSRHRARHPGRTLRNSHDDSEASRRPARAPVCSNCGTRGAEPGPEIRRTRTGQPSAVRGLGSCADLREQRGRVGDLPLLRDAAVLEAADGDHRERDLTAGRRRAQELACVDAA